MSEEEDVHKQQKEAIAKKLPLVNRFCFGRCVKSPQRSFSVEQEHCLNVCVIKAINALEFMDKVNSNGGVDRLQLWTTKKFP